MKLTAPDNANYAAVVVKIKTITPLENCDNVVGTPLLGYQAIVSKDTAVDDMGIMFPAESQLSEEYTRLNNLFRHSDLNEDHEAQGYIEDNRRVKAMKFRGNRSDCLFMPLSSLSFAADSPASLSELKEGDTFDELNGHEICKKYLVKAQERNGIEKNKEKTFKRVDAKFLPEHYDSDNFFRNRDLIPKGTRVIVTQKLHGTSIRIGNTIVARKLRPIERLANWCGLRIQRTEFDYVFGSRKVIKDINNPNQNHYYATDIWTDEGRKLEGLIPENYLVYGELIGWTPNNAPIQKNYTYQIPTGACELYVYRVAFVNGQGIVSDLAWDQVKEFCRDHGLRHVPELWVCRIEDFVVENWLDQRFEDLRTISGDAPFSNGYPLDVVPLAKESPCDEGVCVRVDGLAPYILKAKSPKFLEHETKMNDQEVVDLETEGSNV